MQARTEQQWLWTGKTNQVLRKGEKLGIAYEVSTVNSPNMSAESHVQTVSSSDEVDKDLPGIDEGSSAIKKHYSKRT